MGWVFVSQSAETCVGVARSFLLIRTTFALSAVEDSLQIAFRPTLEAKAEINFGCSSTSDAVKQEKEIETKKNFAGGGEKFVVKLSEIWQMYDGMTNNLIFIDGGIVELSYFWVVSKWFVKFLM